ncbi:ATP-binding protein [Micromonospora tulbaghiae]|uniref:ATP-binding protein n=1 Tax=Micromonospora tulbaghiae TaxID=479978 RepID=UPI003EC01D11
MNADVWGPEPADPARPHRDAVTTLMSQHFTGATVTALRHALAAKVCAAGLAGDPCFDFVLAAHELITNAVRHGGGHGRIELRREEDTLICEITDQGETTDNLPVRPPTADVPGGRGLWLAHQLTDGLILTHRPDGVTATVTVCLQPSSGPNISAASAARHNDDLSTPGEGTT